MIADSDQGSGMVDGYGHRTYIGGLWDQMGRLQFEFLKRQGLRPEHVLLDIACGSLRGGVHFIPYLNAGNYLGIDIKQELLNAGVNNELGPELYEMKKPELVASGEFEFRRFSKRPDFAIAQSLFTHLTPADVVSCLANLSAFRKPRTQLFATYFLAKTPLVNPAQSHPHDAFSYTKAEMIEFGAMTGWNTKYIGHWDHPRGQVIVRYF
jgi:hypothetical protein